MKAHARLDPSTCPSQTGDGSVYRDGHVEQKLSVCARYGSSIHRDGCVLILVREAVIMNKAELKSKDNSMYILTPILL